MLNEINLLKNGRALTDLCTGFPHSLSLFFLFKTKLQFAIHLPALFSPDQTRRCGSHGFTFPLAGLPPEPGRRVLCAPSFAANCAVTAGVIAFHTASPWLIVPNPVSIISSLSWGRAPFPAQHLFKSFYRSLLLILAEWSRFTQMSAECRRGRFYRQPGGTERSSHPYGVLERTSESDGTGLNSSIPLFWQAASLMWVGLSFLIHEMRVRPGIVEYLLCAQHTVGIQQSQLLSPPARLSLLPWLHPFSSTAVVHGLIPGMPLLRVRGPPRTLLAMFHGLWSLR